MDRWFVLCSGPSLTDEDIERVGQEKHAGRGKVVAVNSTILFAPWADILYAWDTKWWGKYYKDVKDLPCRKMSTNPGTKNKGVEVIKREKTNGLGKEGVGGNNSGHHGINVAYLQGAKEIVILGFDCQHVGGKAHHFGDHPSPLGNAKHTTRWQPHAQKLATDLRRAGVKTVNCSPLTALTCFPVMTLKEYLRGNN